MFSENAAQSDLSGGVSVRVTRHALCRRPCFTVLLDRVFIVQEERMLADTFGDQFRQYRNQVRRWI